MSYSANEICSLVADILSHHKEIRAALLMGSCARGEETYFVNNNGEQELLSDVEMLIIAHDNCSTEECSKELTGLALKLKQQSTSPCFELEWSYKTESEVKRLDKRFIFFEAKDSARVIYGDENVLSLFPNITIKNLNYSELDTVIIHRLYHVFRDYLNEDKHYQQYLIARNTLDIPTAILPLIGVLRSSYKARNRAFIERMRPDDLPDGLTDRLTDYLEMKKDYDIDLYNEYPLEEMRRQFVTDMKFLYQFQAKKQHGHPFIRNKRLLQSAIYRRNIKYAYEFFNWEKLNNQLYSRMVTKLESGKISEKQISGISGRMYSIYGYK